MTLQPYLNQIKLPGIIIPGNIFLAPMAGFTDRAMREICSGFGADMTFSEMVSCEGVIRDNKKTTVLLEHDPEKEPFFAVQIFTADPEAAFSAVKKILPYSPVLIDLNCGCPVPKVVKNGAGSALMHDPKKIGSIVNGIKRAINENSESAAARKTAVSVKLRTGWDNSEITYLECAQEAQKAGADMISLHGRTRKQGYSGQADWSAVKKLKENSSVPVIGSGDIFSAADAVRMLETTGCDGIMIARGAVGNPFIFEQIKAGGGENPVPAEQKLKTAEKQLALAVKHLGERRACSEMKKHVCSYSKGLPGGSSLRNLIVHAATEMEYRQHIDAYLKDMEARRQQISD